MSSSMEREPGIDNLDVQNWRVCIARVLYSSVGEQPLWCGQRRTLSLQSGATFLSS